MSKYTITIKKLKDNNFDFGLKSYPIFNESYRETLNNNILNHYLISEIGFETPALFKHFLNQTLNEIMPKYNKLYEAQEFTLEELLTNANFDEVSTSKTKSNSNSNNDSKTLFQDTPQGLISFTDFENQTWATNLTMNKSNILDNTNTDGNNTRKIKGNNGNKYKIELINDIKNNFNNIDLLIIKELEDLFMGLF